MTIDIESSFDRDAKKLPDSLLDELKLVFEALESAQSLADVGYEVKKMEGSKKVKAFRLKLSKHNDFRIGFYLEGDTIVLSRILNRKDIYKAFPLNANPPMCVVTLLPIAGGFLLTTNRDEHISRPAALPPQTYTVANYALAFPKDPQGGGTWLAASSKQIVCLLNGAFPSDNARVTSHPKKSRGLVVVDLFAYDDPFQFADQYDFGGIEPFTLVIARMSVNRQDLFELRWNGQQIWLRPLEADKPHIWSSYTLYDAGSIALRKIWFTQFLQANHNHYTPDALFKFHQTAGNGDPARDYVMHRPTDGVRTVSLTQVAYAKRAGTMRYLDLATHTETHLNF